MNQRNAETKVRDVAMTIQLATEADIAELLQLRLSVDADQARRFGNARWSTTINEKSVMRALKSPRVLVARERWASLPPAVHDPEGVCR